MSSDAIGATVSVTRTADTNAYAANDVIGAATGSTAALTFAGMGAPGSRIMITSTQLAINDTGVISGETSYRLHLYNVTPPSALGDNGAWDLPAGDRNAYLGFIDLGTVVDMGSTLYVEQNIYNKQIVLTPAEGANTQSLYAYLVTIGAYTPSASRVYKITLHGVKL